MKRFLQNISLVLIVSALMLSCKRKELTDDCLCTTTMLLPISVNWATCGITPQNVTLLVYDSATGKLRYEHKYEHNSRAIQSYVRLPKGDFTAVLFNELRGEIDYVDCVGHSNLSTLKFKSRTESSPVLMRSSDKNYVKSNIGDLAVVTVENIIITEEMILEMETAIASFTNYAEFFGTRAPSLSTTTRTAAESLLNLEPLKKSTTINIKAHVKNLYYSRAALMDVVNLADGYYVYGDQNSGETSTLQFEMTNRVYDTYYDGTLSASFTTFGTLVNRGSTSSHDASTPVVFDAVFQMVDEPPTLQNLQMDVTSEVKHTQNSDGSYTIDIDIAFAKELTPVTPSGSDGDSGFGSVVEGWGPVQTVPIF